MLADRIGVPCTLVRGDYNLAWNEVMLAPTQINKKAYPPIKYVVDLLHDPGRLLKHDTPDAHVYQTICTGAPPEPPL